MNSEQGGLAGLGGAGGDDVEAGDDRRLQEASALANHDTEPNEFGKKVGTEHECDSV